MSDKPVIHVRARSKAGKALRRQSILQAAEGLFAQDPTVLPTIAEISNDCGLAKGTIYIYFPSKEAIFLALLEEALSKWTERLCEVANDTGSPVAVVDALCDHLATHPRLMQLACLSTGVLEPNVTTEILFAFKHSISDNLHRTAQQLIPMFSDGRRENAVVQMLLQTYALLIGLWQLSHPTHCARGMSSPELERLQPAFVPTAHAALQRLWQIN
ncbi:TetR family transcriptional regulator [Pokkaliibacter plantistimulans]|nr:TetR family transcriptional regulator [Pokkaliibacter plantistimulans]